MEAWLPALTAIIAAAATLAGVFLNNYLGRRDRAEERTDAARRDSAEALLRRGEELFLFVDRVDGYVAQHVELIERYCHGHVEQDHYASRRVELMKLRQGLELGRIQLSVQAFFPEILELHEEATTNLRYLATLDSVAVETVDPTATTIYKLSADAARLRKVSQRNGQATRAILAQIVRESFATAGSIREVPKPLDPSGAAR